MKPFTALLLILFAAGCATAPAALPQPEARGIVYDTEVRFDLEAALLKVESSLSYVADEATAGKVGLVLNQGLQVEGVRGSAVRTHRVLPFEPEPSWNLVEVELDGVSPGSTVALEIAYSGKPVFVETGINGISPQWVELNLDSVWHPLLSTFDRELTGVLRLALPPDWKVAGSGAGTLVLAGRPGPEKKKEDAAGESLRPHADGSYGSSQMA